MRKLFLAASLLVSSLAFSQVKLTSAQIHRADSIVKSNIDFASIELELIVLINEYRKSLNLDTLKYDSKVHNAAKCQVDYNISINKLTHDNIGELNGILERVEKFTGIRPSTAGEVLATTTPLSSEAFNRTIAEHLFILWKDSPSHNAIIISPKMKSIGVSVNRKTNTSGAIYAGAVLNSL
jgi:uncharacterized protein YkwD